MSAARVCDRCATAIFGEYIRLQAQRTAVGNRSWSVALTRDLCDDCWRSFYALIPPLHEAGV